MYVYLIQSGKSNNSPVKIGVAKEPEKRILELQIGNAYLLTLIGKIPAKSRKHAEYIESRLHRYFAKYHIRGEWFKGKKINIKQAVDYIGNDCLSYDDVKGSAIHGTKKEQKIERLSSENKSLHVAIKHLNDSIDSELDRECLANMPEL